MTGTVRRYHSGALLVVTLGGLLTEPLARRVGAELRDLDSRVLVLDLVAVDDTQPPDEAVDVLVAALAGRTAAGMTVYAVNVPPALHPVLAAAGSILVDTRDHPVPASVLVDPDVEPTPDEP